MTAAAIASSEAFEVYLLALAAGVTGLCGWKGEPSLWCGRRRRAPDAE